MSNIESAIKAAASENPNEFRSGIEAEIMNKLSDAIDARKMQIATAYLRPEEPVIEPEEPSEVVDDQTD